MLKQIETTWASVRLDGAYPYGQKGNHVRRDSNTCTATRPEYAHERWGEKLGCLVREGARSMGMIDLHDIHHIHTPYVSTLVGIAGKAYNTGINLASAPATHTCFQC